MHVKTLFVSGLAVLPFTAYAESDSPWLPIPGQVLLSVGYSDQSGKDARIGDTRVPISMVTGGAATKYARTTTSIRLDYGLSDSLAIDASIGRGSVKVGAADSDSGQVDSTLGLRWRLFDEFEDNSIPTFTLRAAGIIKGNYDGARLASLGKGANGYELAMILGKQLTSSFALWGEVGIQNRSDNVPNATFFEIGARYRFAPQWSASVGYSDKKFGGDLDIGGPGFSPARFQQVREERGVAKLGVAFAIAGNQTIALNYAKTTSGRNTVLDDQVLGISYTYAF